MWKKHAAIILSLFAIAGCGGGTVNDDHSVNTVTISGDGYGGNTISLVIAMQTTGQSQTITETGEQPARNALIITWVDQMAVEGARFTYDLYINGEIPKGYSDISGNSAQWTPSAAGSYEIWVVNSASVESEHKQVFAG